MVDEIIICSGVFSSIAPCPPHSPARLAGQSANQDKVFFIEPPAVTATERACGRGHAQKYSRAATFGKHLR